MHVGVEVLAKFGLAVIVRVRMIVIGGDVDVGPWCSSGLGLGQRGLEALRLRLIEAAPLPPAKPGLSSRRYIPLIVCAIVLQEHRVGRLAATLGRRAAGGCQRSCRRRRGGGGDQ